MEGFWKGAKKVVIVDVSSAELANSASLYGVEVFAELKDDESGSRARYGESEMSERW